MPAAREAAEMRVSAWAGIHQFVCVFWLASGFDQTRTKDKKYESLKVHI